MHFSSFSKKVLVGTITLLFLGVLFLIYLFISSKPSEKHLNFIPATAQSVLIIDPFEIGEELKTQIQKNPSLILKFDLTQLFSENVSIGINPLAKIGIFQDSLEKKFIIGGALFKISQFLEDFSFSEEHVIVGDLIGESVNDCFEMVSKSSKK